MRIPGTRGIGWLCAGYLLFNAVATPAFAHHSFAMFDHDHQVKLVGTVTRFQWTNPHVYIDLAVDSSSGAAPVKRYTIECANPGILDRSGWKWNMIKVGDKITAVVAPLHSGQPGGLLKEVRLADGREFGNGGPAGKANIAVGEK